ncbi:hypothetical protein Q2Y39_000594, partial [Campylobacter coli]|nr:hypothetical protein [Campylobacter coli]
FLCIFIPFKSSRNKFRKQFLHKNIPYRQTYTYLPKQVLKNITSLNNEYFIKENKTTHGGGARGILILILDQKIKTLP